MVKTQKQNLLSAAFGKKTLAAFFSAVMTLSLPVYAQKAPDLKGDLTAPEENSVDSADSQKNKGSEPEAEENPLEIVNPDAPKPELQRTVQIVTSEWDYDLNPYTASYNSEAQILTALYEGLFSYNPMTVEAVPALCSSYKLSRDKKRWTFTLREASFSNGEPITAYTIRDSWLRMLRTPDAQFASLIDCITGAKDYRLGKIEADEVKIQAKDEKTLVVHLNAPTAELPQILCQQSFAAVSENLQNYSGAFVLKSWKNGVLELEKNQNYRDKAHVYVPGIKVTQIDDEKECTYLYNTGKADWIDENVDLDTLLENDSIQLSAMFGTHYYFFKMNDNVWNKPEFRRALIEAVPYDKLRESSLIKAETLIYPLAGYPEVTGYSDSDIEDAADLLEDARKKYGISSKQKLELKIAVGSADKTGMQQAELLKAEWEKLGIKVTIQTTPSQRYVSSIPYWNADLFLYGWIGDYADPLAFLDLFRSDSSLNVGKYSNGEFDELLYQASIADSTSERYKLLAKAEQLLLDDGEVIPVRHSVSLHIINPDQIGGWYTNALDLHPFKYLYFKPYQYEVENIVMLK